MRGRLVTAVLIAGAAASLIAAPSPAKQSSRASALCSSSYVSAVIGGETKCLRAGEFCKVGDSEYHRYGFTCPANGHLTYYGGASSTRPKTTPTVARVPTVGITVLVAHRTRTHDCRLGPEPDRRCSPGAYYSKLTTEIVCSAGFRTNTIRDVSEPEKHAVEIEYGLAPESYGQTLEIDHIVSLELGGSNDIANLFPEKANAHPGYHVKDRLENKLHDLVCAGQMTLRTAQRKIATNWQMVYKQVYGVAPA